MPTFVDIAGGPKGDDLKQADRGRQYPGIVKTKLDGVNQRAYLEGKSEVGARCLLLLLGRDAISGALQELEDVLHDDAAGAAGWSSHLSTIHWTMVQNIKRDPFEQAVAGREHKTAMGLRVH